MSDPIGSKFLPPVPTSRGEEVRPPSPSKSQESDGSSGLQRSYPVFLAPIPLSHRSVSAPLDAPSLLTSHLHLPPFLMDPSSEQPLQRDYSLLHRQEEDNHGDSPLARRRSVSLLKAKEGGKPRSDSPSPHLSRLSRRGTKREARSSRDSLSLSPQKTEKQTNSPEHSSSQDMELSHFKFEHSQDHSPSLLSEFLHRGRSRETRPLHDSPHFPKKESDKRTDSPRPSSSKGGWWRRMWRSSPKDTQPKEPSPSSYLTPPSSNPASPLSSPPRISLGDREREESSPFSSPPTSSCSSQRESLRQSESPRYFSFKEKEPKEQRSSFPKEGVGSSPLGKQKSSPPLSVTPRSQKATEATFPLHHSPFKRPSPLKKTDVVPQPEEDINLPISRRDRAASCGTQRSHRSLKSSSSRRRLFKDDTCLSLNSHPRSEGEGAPSPWSRKLKIIPLSSLPAPVRDKIMKANKISPQKDVHVVFMQRIYHRSRQQLRTISGPKGLPPSPIDDALFCELVSRPGSSQLAWIEYKVLDILYNPDPHGDVSEVSSRPQLNPTLYPFCLPSREEEKEKSRCRDKDKESEESEKEEDDGTDEWDVR